MAKKNIPLEIINLDENGFHVLVDVTLFKKPFKLVLDTGASKTAFDKTMLLELLEEKHLKKQGFATTASGANSLESFMVILQDFYIGKFHLPQIEVAVLDLSAINIAYQSMAIPSVLGVLGGDILVEYQAVIDYARCKMTLKNNQAIRHS